MSPEAFTSYVMQHLKAEIPDLQVTNVDTLAFETNSPSKDNWQVFLDNDYRSYLNKPEPLPDILADRLGAMREILARMDVAVSVERVLPVVRDTYYFHTIQAQAKADLPHLILTDFLVVLYVLDNKHSMQFVTKEILADLNLSPERLHDAAIENLEGHVAGFEVVEEDGLYAITGADSYEASLILLDSIWTGRQLDVQGDFVVFMPSRNFFMVTGSEDRENLALGQAIARMAFDREDHPLTSRPLVRRNGRWLPFEP